MNSNRDDAQHAVSPLMRESLVDKKVIAGTEAPVHAILPKINIIQIGGLSIMDRGRRAVLPLLDEIVANQNEYTLVVGTGPGVRARRIFLASEGSAITASRPESVAIDAKKDDSVCWYRNTRSAIR
jgi:molybdenum storage protein